MEFLVEPTAVVCATECYGHADCVECSSMCVDF